MTTQEIDSVAEKQYNDANYILTNPIVRDDSTLETISIRYQPNGDSSLSSRFNTKGAFIEFETTGRDIINIEGIRFLVKGKIGFGTETIPVVAHADDAQTYPVMNMSEMFQRANLKIGGVVVSSTDFIGKQDTLLKLLYHSHDHGLSVDTNHGFYPNLTIGNHTDANVIIRSARFVPVVGTGANLLNFNFIYKPAFGILNCKKYLYNTPIKMYFERAGNEDFFAKGGTANTQIPALFIDSMEMIVETIKPELNIKMEYEKQMLNGYNLQYKDSFMERYNITAGIITERRLLTNLSAKPEAIFIAFQAQTRTAGMVAATAKGDPSIYDQSAITDIALNINGSHRIPYQRQELNYTTNTYALAFDDLMRLVGSHKNTDSGSLINYSNFKTLYNIYGFDLRNNPNSDVPELNQNSTRIELEINLSSAFAASHMYVMYVFNNVLKIIGGPNGVTIPQLIFGTCGR